MSAVTNILDNFKNIGEDINILKDNFLNVFENPRMRITVAILVIVFFGISLYIYFNLIHPKLNLDYVPNREFVNNSEGDKIVVMWFYTQWCPFCKSTYSEWTSFKNDAEQKNFAIPIEFREIDCDNDERFASRYNIEEYPSVRLVYRDEVYIYDAKPDRYQLMEFLKGSIPDDVTIEERIENVFVNKDSDNKDSDNKDYTNN